MSNGGDPGTHVPSCSPLKIPGALSLIPSPMTTSPQMFIRSNMPRMASQAARVGSFLVAASEPAQGVEGRRFSCSHKIELNDSFDVGVVLFGQPRIRSVKIHAAAAE